MSDIEDEILQRQHALSVLEEDTEELVGDRRRAGVRDRYADDELIGSEDDLDVAEQVSNAAGPSSGLLHKVSMRDRKWEDLNEIAKFSRINPPSVLQGTLGAQQLVNIGESIQLANWGGNDAETLPVTVIFAPVDSSFVLTGGNPSFRPFGIVQFGTRGFLIKVEVDIIRGCQFTINASAVTLQASLEQPVPAGIGGLQLTGMLSFYPCVRTTPITRTVYIDNLAGGGAASGNTNIPMFAKRIFALRNDNTNQIDLNVLDSTGNLVTNITIAAGAQMAGPVLLPGHALYVNVLSTGALASTDISLIYELQL